MSFQSLSRIGSFRVCRWLGFPANTPPVARRESRSHIPQGFAGGSAGTAQKEDAGMPIANAAILKEFGFTIFVSYIPSR